MFRTRMVCRTDALLVSLESETCIKTYMDSKKVREKKKHEPIVYQLPLFRASGHVHKFQGRRLWTPKPMKHPDMPRTMTVDQGFGSG
jgi:hypothetical protein